MLFCALLHFADPTEGQSRGSVVVRKSQECCLPLMKSLPSPDSAPLQGVKIRFALFFHQRVKGFFKNLYLEATSGKQLEKLLPLHDKNKQINSGAEKEAQTKGSHVLWQRDFMRTQPSYRGKKQWKYISLTYINTNIHPE